MTRPMWADFTAFWTTNRSLPRIHIRRGESFQPNPIVKGYCHNMMAQRDAEQEHMTISRLNETLRWCEVCVTRFLAARERQ